MARMIPPYISDDVNSSGEKQLFELFKNDPDTTDWIILHSLGLSRHIKRLYGEIDFLVMVPRKGIFCLEIKSGRISRKDGIWFYTDKFGETKSDKRGPFMQAQEGMFSIQNRINEKFGEKHKNLLYGYGVMFPHIIFECDGPDFEQWQVYDKNSKRFPVSKYIINLAEYYKIKCENTNWFKDESSLPKTDAILEILQFLRGDFEKIIPYIDIEKDLEDKIEYLTEEQFQCLDQMQDNERCLFQGAAGTGKTILAIESFKRNIYENKRTLFLCYNKLLSDWIKSKFPNEKLSNDSEISTFHAYLYKLIPKQKIINHQNENSKEFFRETLPILALEEIEKEFFKPFDKIIIDEGQDIINPEYLDILDSSLKGGLTGGHWQIFCDLEKQNIFSDYSAGEIINLLQKRANFAKCRLTVNCRNTKQIGEEVASVCELRKGKYLPNNIYGLPVEYFTYKTADEEESKIEKILDDLINNKKVHPGKITLLSPHKLENTCLKKSHKNLKITSDFIVPDSCKKITFFSIQSFKGLENSYIIIFDIGIVSDEEFLKLLYVGMTRAKTGLFILAKDDFMELRNKKVTDCLNEKGI